MPWFNNLPELAQMEITKWRLKSKTTYNRLFEDTPLTSLSPKAIIHILTRLSIVRKSNTFKIGNLLIAKKAVDRGMLIVFNASDDDVTDYSDRGRYYYIFGDNYKL